MRWLVFLAACQLGESYRCSGDAQCVLGAERGRCEPSGYCSFDDTGCSSGRRYGRWSPFPSTCVADGDLGVEVDAANEDLSSSPDSACGGDLQPCCNGACEGGLTCGNNTCFLFYDGFDGPIAPGWSPKQQNGSTVAPDTKAYRGSGSLKVTANAGTLTWEQVLLIRPSSRSPLYARAFFFIPSTATLSNADDTGLMGYSNSNNAPFPFAGLGLTSTFRVTVFVNNWPAASRRAISVNALPLDTWACIEWRVQYDGEASVEAFVNDAPVASIAPSPLPNPQNVYSLGFAGPPPASSFTFWMDELAFDTHSIGCSR